MNCRSIGSLVKPALLILSAVVLLVSATQSIDAKPKMAFTPNVGTSGSAALAANTKAARRIMVRLISRKAKGNSNSALRFPSVCTCTAAPDSEESFGSCFRSCLQAWGISYGSLTTCGGLCGLGSTGNPVGIAGCAACLGTAEWIVMGCSLNCMYKESRWGLVDTVKTHRPRTRGLQQAKLTVKRVTSG